MLGDPFAQDDRTKENAAFVVGRSPTSDAHGHQDVAGLVFGFGVFGADLAGALRILELEAHFAVVVAVAAGAIRKKGSPSCRQPKSH